MERFDTAERTRKSTRTRNSDGTYRYAIDSQAGGSVQVENTEAYNDPEIRRERELRRQQRDLQQVRSGTWQSSDQKIETYALKARILSDQALIDYENALRSERRWLEDPDMELMCQGAQKERARRLQSSSWPWNRLFNKRWHTIWRVHDLEMAIADSSQNRDWFSTYKHIDKENREIGDSLMQSNVRVMKAELEVLKSKLRRL